MYYDRKNGQAWFSVNERIQGEVIREATLKLGKFYIMVETWKHAQQWDIFNP